LLVILNNAINKPACKSVVNSSPHEGLTEEPIWLYLETLATQTTYVTLLHA
jgi:hypothetical protein